MTSPTDNSDRGMPSREPMPLFAACPVSALRQSPACLGARERAFARYVRVKLRVAGPVAVPPSADCGLGSA